MYESFCDFLPSGAVLKLASKTASATDGYKTLGRDIIRVAVAQFEAILLPWQAKLQLTTACQCQLGLPDNVSRHRAACQLKRLLFRVITVWLRPQNSMWVKRTTTFSTHYKWLGILYLSPSRSTTD